MKITGNTEKALNQTSFSSLCSKFQTSQADRVRPHPEPDLRRSGRVQLPAGGLHLQGPVHPAPVRSRAGRLVLGCAELAGPESEPV